MLQKKKKCDQERERARVNAIILGTGNSPLAEVNPILVLFRPGAIMLVELETEPDGSISQGETLPCLFESISSHLT